MSNDNLNIMIAFLGIINLIAWIIIVIGHFDCINTNKINYIIALLISILFTASIIFRYFHIKGNIDGK